MYMGLSVDLLFPVLNEHLRLEKGIRGTMKYLRENFDAAELSVPAADPGQRVG
jgi:hypothetical protein